MAGTQPSQPKLSGPSPLLELGGRPQARRAISARVDARVRNQGRLYLPVQVNLPKFGTIEVEHFSASPDNDRSVAETVVLMGLVIQASTSHPAIVQAAQSALASLGQSAPAWRKAQAIFSYIKARVRFMTDEAILAKYFSLGPDFELLIKPELLLHFGHGDCDCHSMLTCAMLGAAGLECRLITIAADPDQPERYSHVYAAAVLESGELLPMDTSHGQKAGWEAPWCFRRQEWGPA